MWIFYFAFFSSCSPQNKTHTMNCYVYTKNDCFYLFYLRNVSYSLRVRESLILVNRYTTILKLFCCMLNAECLNAHTNDCRFFFSASFPFFLLFFSALMFIIVLTILFLCLFLFFIFQFVVVVVVRHSYSRIVQQATAKTVRKQQ